MPEQYRVKAIISAVQPCQCCGNKNLKKNVILERSEGDLYYVGSDCAGKLVHGIKSRKNRQLVVDEAKEIERARVVLESHGAFEAIALINRRSCSQAIIDSRIAAIGLPVV